MTTNKPEIACWGSFYKGVLQDFGYNEEATKAAAEMDFHGYTLSIEPLIRLSDYEALQADRDQQYDMKVKAREQRDAVTANLKALQAECDKLRKDATRYQSLLEAVLREIPHRKGSRGNAPGHAHSVPGIWDEDNGALAGKECAWCKVWNEAMTAMEGDAP